MSYQTAAIRISLSDLQGHSPRPTASLAKCYFFVSGAKFDKIST